MAAGRSTRYSEANPLVRSEVSAFQPAPFEYVWPAAMLKPTLVITSSPVCASAPAVEVVAVVDATAAVNVPVWSSGATAAAPLHSESWASPLMVAGLNENVALVMPPGLLG